MRADGGMKSIIRTERDIPINYVMIGIALLLIPVTYFLYHFLSNPNLPFNHGGIWLPLIVCFFFVPIAGFVFSSLCGYFAGLVGSSVNPLSSLALSALLLASLILILIFGLQADYVVGDTQRLAAAACAVLITTIVTCAAAITNDTIQDLKTGQIVGATPWKQQVMLILGTVVAALIIAPVLELLFNAYGIGDVMPRVGMNPAQALAAPQAMLMATIAKGVFTHELPWNMIFVGFGIAAVAIAVDEYLKTKQQRLPVLAIGFGIYLPASVGIAMGAGAILSYLVKRSLKKKNATAAQAGEQRALVIACGIIAGAALMGVILAIPFTIMLSTDALKLVGDSFTPIANVLGFVSIFGLMIWIYRAACKS
jgi:putative OPT family oligopeptide transporter